MSLQYFSKDFYPPAVHISVLTAQFYNYEKAVVFENLPATTSLNYIIET